MKPLDRLGFNAIAILLAFHLSFEASGADRRGFYLSPRCKRAVRGLVYTATFGGIIWGGTNYFRFRWSRQKVAEIMTGTRVIHPNDGASPGMHVLSDEASKRHALDILMYNGLLAGSPGEPITPPRADDVKKFLLLPP